MNMPTKDQDGRRILGVPEVAARLRVSNRRVVYILKNGAGRRGWLKLPGIRLGRQWAVLEDDLKEFSKAFAKSRSAKPEGWRYDAAKDRPKVKRPARRLRG